MPSSIINSDDGVVSGTSGLKSVGGDDGVLVFQSKGTETARINTDKQIVAAAGTNSLPALTTTGDLNTGIYFPAADQVAIATNGVERVKQSNSATVFNETGADVDFRVEGDTEANLFFVDASAEAIGFGTSSPESGARLTLDRATFNQIFMKVNGTEELRFYADAAISSIASLTNPLLFEVGGSERARITSGGYFKASNSGAYNSSTGAYHEFIQTANETNLFIRGTNASFSSSISTIRADRSATSSYNLLQLDSGNGADVEFIFRGDGNAFADGTFQNNGADYAEFFESANGEALTLGATVVLDGNKVREATEEDPASAIIGVVRPKEPSKASMVIGNTAWNKWTNKYLTDDFDRYIMEDHDVVEWEEQVLEKEATEAVEAVVDEEGNEVSPAISAQEAVYKTKSHSYESHRIPEGITVPADATIKTHDDKGNKFQHYKLNPAWDKDAEYVNRENRPEWNIIGLVGQVKVLKGQPTNDRWIKMRDVSATVEEWFIR
jgi:hypothetical protein